MKYFSAGALLLVVLFSAVGSLSADPATVFPVLANVKGVSAEDIAAIDTIKRDRPDGLIYAMMPSDESFIDADGGVGGFSRLLCKHLSHLLGIPVIPKIVDWDDLVHGLDSHEIDLSGELTATPERLAKYRFTTPIAERAFTVYRDAGRPELDLINGRDTVRLGFLQGSITYRRVRETAEISFTPFFFRNYREGAEALQGEEIDAFVAESMMDSAFEGYADIAYQKYYPLAYTTVSLCTGNSKIHPILDVFQKYLDDGGMERLLALYAEGNHEYLRHKLFKQLTEEEREFIPRVFSIGRNGNGRASPTTFSGRSPISPACVFGL